jgi:hypothetical protein
MSSTESDERYQVVMKHYLKGVLHIASFETIEQARTYLMYCWTELPIKDCGAAIYDKHDSRRPILTVGATYLVDEDRGDEPALKITEDVPPSIPLSPSNQKRF